MVNIPRTVQKKKIALTIYLLKKTSSGAAWTEKEFLSGVQGKNGRLRTVGCDKHALGADGEFGTLYIKKPINESEPEWLNFVGQGFSNSSPLRVLKNKSVSALLVIERDQRQFAIAFGHGRYMLDATRIEDRFGIRVVLNSIEPDKISSIDRQTFDASPRISRTQTIKASSVSDYSINAEQDLLRGLVGFSKSEYSAVLGDLIAGIDAFKTSVAIDLKDLGDLLSTSLSRSESKDYLKSDIDGNGSEFAWVENLLPVKDKNIIEELENDLWRKLDSSDLGGMWMAVPEIVDWANVTGFCYKVESCQDELDSYLDLSKFLASLRKNANLETVKKREVYMMKSQGEPPARFKAFKCIYAEIKRSTELFILHVGTWFKVEQSFQNSVEKYFIEIRRKTFSPPFINYHHIGEGDYNNAVCVAAPTTHAMLDRQLIQFGGKHDKIEVCDIYTGPSKLSNVNNKCEFIHVKRGRSSSTLSHLFSQGLVSSTLLVKEPDFVKEVNKQLEKNSFDELPLRFSGHGHEVIFAIIDGQSGVPLDLPFFSKVTLQNCCKSIVAFGYAVSLMHIPESAAYLASEKIKKAVKAKNKKIKK
jgi:uncharacterized protein (TIGR04141 family)